MPVDVIKEAVAIFGPAVTGVGLGVWWFLTWRTKRQANGSVAEEAKQRSKMREAIITMDANVGNIMEDVKETKADVKDVQATVTQHLRDHAQV